LAIVVCPNAHKLRIPDGKRGKVTCPTCRAEWFHPEAVELSDVEFRCSKSGSRFNVVLSRRSPLHKFVVQKVNKPTQDASKLPETETPVTLQRREADTAPPPLPLAAPRIGGWLARIVGRKPVVAAEKPPDSLLKKQPASMAVATHNADEYNWAGFVCPYCRATGLISCGGGHLVCDGRAVLRNGKQFHQCFCGHAGFITGTIKSFEDKRLSVEAEVKATPSAKPKSQKPSGNATEIALPPPMKGRNPVKP
jgi:hypothetical protein